MDDLVNYEKTDRENLGLEVPPKGKHVFGMVKVGDKGQIVIPANARKIFDIQPGDNLLILGDEEQGIAILKEKKFSGTSASDGTYAAHGIRRMIKLCGKHPPCTEYCEAE